MSISMTNSSPYGSNMNFQTSPMPGQSQSRSPFWSALFGKPEQNYQQSLLDPRQQPILQNLYQASQQKGAGGAFGEVADYNRSLLSDDNSTLNALIAPDMRKFFQDILPQIAEQFSGHGGISSSGFRNSAIGAGTDLAERISAQRAMLRQQGSEGLRNIGQLALNQYGENIHRPETYGFIGDALHGIGKGAGKATGTYIGSKF